MCQATTQLPHKVYSLETELELNATLSIFQPLFKLSIMGEIRFTPLKRTTCKSVDYQEKKKGEEPLWIQILRQTNV